MTYWILAISLANLFMMLFLSAKLDQLNQKVRVLKATINLVGWHYIGQEKQYHERMDRPLPITHFLVEKALKKITEVDNV